MGRWSNERRAEEAAKAAKAASEAGRLLQERQQQTEKAKAGAEPAASVDPGTGESTPAARPERPEGWRPPVARNDPRSQIIAELERKERSEEHTSELQSQ